MFEAASESFVKAIGNETLLPITAIDRADNCMPLHVVVKKKRYWVWQSPKYQPTSFTLNEILTDKEKDLGVKTTSHELLSYSRKSIFSADGRLGIKIAKELVDVEVSGNDLVELTADLGRVDKLEAEPDDISDALQDRNMNFSHDLVEETMKDPKKVLCVVVATAITTKDSTITSDKTAGGKADINVEPELVKPDIEGNVSDKDSNNLIIPKGTAIAYVLKELLVFPDGGIKLALLDGTEGEFVSVEDCREEAKIKMNLDTPPMELFAPLISLSGSDKWDFQHSVYQIGQSESSMEGGLLFLTSPPRGPRFWSFKK